MSRSQFILLNVVSVLLALIILINLWLAFSSQHLNSEMVQTQITVNQAKQAERFLTQLSGRIARDSEKDPALRELLVRHDIRVNLDIEGRKKSVP